MKTIKIINKKIFLLVLFISVFHFIKIEAADSLLVQGDLQAVTPGQQTTLLIGITPDAQIDFRSFQVSVDLPEGLRLMSIEKSDVLKNFDIVTQIPSEGRTGKIIIGVLDLTSPQGGTLSGAGYLLILSIKVDEDASPLNGDITVSDASFGTLDGDDIFIDGEENIPVTINVPAKEITLNETTLALMVGQEFLLTATVTPSNASDTNVSWSMINGDGIVTVNEGKIKAISSGNATVRATCGTV